MTETPEGKKPIEEAEEENALFVVDSETYQQNKQLKQIYKAKEEYAKLHREAEPADQAVYWSKIKALIMELEPLMRQMETDVDYLNEYHLTTVDLATTQFEVHWSERIESLGCGSKEEAIQTAIHDGYIVRDYDVTGLNRLLDANAYLGYHADHTTQKTAINTNDGWKVDTSIYSSRPRFEKATVHVLTETKKHYDRQVFDKAYRGCREFMSEAGLALNLEEDKDPVRI
jgi:hypothetical protein